MNTQRTAPRAAAGFSLVELMVSVVIGMLAILFATKLVVGGEQSKDSAVGGSDSMQNGMLALYSISNDVAQAGWGLNDPLAAGCNTSFVDASGYELAQQTVGGVVTTPLAAAVIEPGGAGADTISLYTGKSASAVGSLRTNGAVNIGAALLPTTVKSPFGFAAGDVLLVVPEPATAVNPGCAIVQMAGTQGAPNDDKIVIGGGSGFRYSPATGIAAGFALGGGRIFNLGPGQLLSFHTWSVVNGVLLLRATDLAGAESAGVAVTDNIVSIKAQYGFDARVIPGYNPAPAPDGNGVQLTQWSNDMIDADGDAVAGGPGDFQRVVAVRLAVVARSKNPEKPAANGQCSATTVAPVLFGSASPATVAPVPVTAGVAVAGDTVSWRCYRYRVFETIVPLRNAQWRP
jgi:type IV pilus assembly protein PilW